MRKRYTIVILAFLICSACMAAPAEIAGGKDEKKAMKIAVLPFGIGTKVSKDVVHSLSEALRVRLRAGGEYDVITTSEMAYVFQNKKLGILAACDTARCLARIGKMLGVRKVIAGGVIRDGEGFSVALKLVDVITMSDEDKAKGSLASSSKEDIEKAAKSMAKLIKPEAGPDNSDRVYVSEVITPPNTPVGQKFKRGVELYKEKKYNEAIELLTEACKSEGGTENIYSEAHAIRGFIYQFHSKETDHFRKAYIAYRMALEWNPRNRLARKYVYVVKKKSYER